MDTKLMVRLTISFILSVLLLVVSGCANSPEQLIIIGKWVNDNGHTIEFHQDGTMTGSVFSRNPIPGTYTWVDDTHIETTFRAKDIESLTVYIDMPIVTQFQITSLTQDTLKLTLGENSLSYYSRVNE